ncbi:hypothetical protein AB0B50_40610 [Streptomyces sp. NPDC041068]|uniref:hypothetical protein n=1 Tax=Streptomyces sp. NPDC041068 TaxID=3155130 RepID=UPI0034090E39
MFGFSQADGHLRQGADQKGKLSVEINVRDIGMTLSTAVGVHFARYVRQLTGPERSGAERLIKRNARDGICNVLHTKENAQALAADLHYPGCLALARKLTAADSLSTWIRPASGASRPAGSPCPPLNRRTADGIRGVAPAAPRLRFSPSRK